MPQSPELSEFYNAIHEWIKAGCPVYNEYNFYPKFGLCSNLIAFCVAKGYSETPIILELRAQFEDAGLDMRVPFDLDFNVYNSDPDKYENIERLHWIKSHTCPEE